MTASRLSLADADDVDGEMDAALSRHRQNFAEWLAMRSRLCGNGVLSDAAGNQAEEREAELALLICTTPAARAWVVYDKLEVLREAMAKSCTAGRRTDHRDLILLAGIEADVYRMMDDNNPAPAA